MVKVRKKVSTVISLLCVQGLVVERTIANQIQLVNVQSAIQISDASTWTVATADNITATATGMTLDLSFNWNIYNVVNPGGEIDQLFVAIGHQQVLQPLVYNGHPGAQPGASGSYSQSFDLSSLPIGNYDLVIARMAATSESAAINDYLAGGGWSGKAADLSVVPEPSSIVLGLSAGLLLLRRSRKMIGWCR